MQASGHSIINCGVQACLDFAVVNLLPHTSWQTHKTGYVEELMHIFCFAENLAYVGDVCSGNL